MATGMRAAWRVAQFTIGLFAVNLALGIVVAIGPGRAVLGLVPHPQGTVRHIIELVAGVVLVTAAAALWSGRRKLARRELPGRRSGSSSALVAGGSIAAVEFPTAAPYLAVIAGIVASPASVPQEIALVVLYNIAFVTPLLVIIVVLCLARQRAEPWLARAGEWLQRRWPVVLAGLLLLVGGILTVLGGSGLMKQ